MAQSTANSSAGRPSMAIRPPCVMLAIMSRMASGRPDISRPTSKPSRRPSSRCPSAMVGLGDVQREADADLAGQLQAVLADVGDRRRCGRPRAGRRRRPSGRSGPAPVISTSSPTSGKDSAVCTALPNGSKIAATSRSTGTRCTHTLAAGSATYSAKAPSRPTPRPTVLRHRWRRPARQLRHLPQTRWPSPLTRSPTAMSRDVARRPRRPRRRTRGRATSGVRDRPAAPSRPRRGCAGRCRRCRCAAP